MSANAALPVGPTSAELWLDGIYEVTRLLADNRRLDARLAAIVRHIGQAYRMRNVTAIILDGEGRPAIVATDGVLGGISLCSQDVLPVELVDRIVALASPVVIADRDADPLFRDAAPRPKEPRICFVGVPVKFGAGVLGTLSAERCCDGRQGFRAEDDVRFLTLIANLIGQAAHLARADASLDYCAKTGSPSAGLDRPDEVAGIIGDSPAMQSLVSRLKRIAPSNSTVLLRGETGTGKEVFARALHLLSPRRDAPFVAFNCTALTESVLESELFGHEKGAFTGALATRKGRFELAGNGTIFLDEIGDISPAFQAKLLHVLQDRAFERVGGTKTIAVDARIICATNRNLEEAVARGEFREDLYYRISVVPLVLPPLRERPGDIPALADAFLARFNRENGRTLRLSPEIGTLVSRCRFPGNVRELENCIRRAASMCRSEELRRDDFSCAQGGCVSAGLWRSRQGATAEILPMRAEVPDLPKVEVAVAALPGPSEHGPSGRGPERERVIAALEKAGWVQAKAARLLGLTVRQIRYAIEKNGIVLKKL